jgi:radical SAM superfamily enzyme YgiQ (UPF0313 family)
MKFLLAKPSPPECAPFSTIEKRFPLGIGSLISILRDAGHEVQFVDNFVQARDFIREGDLQHNGIDVLGVYVDTICFNEAMTILNDAQRLRKRKKWNGKIIAGGPHASVMPHTIPDFVDHIVVGEGEGAILRIANGASDRIISAERIKDMDSLPMPAYDIAAQLPYDTNAPFIEGRRVFNMNTSRGCPFDCTFCSVGSVWGRKYSSFSPDRMVEDVKVLMKDHGVGGIYFREDNFTLKRERVVKFCDNLLRENIDVQWMCETRADTLDKELLELMKRAGCTGLYIGAESGSQRVLDFLKKGITTEQVRQVFAWCGEIQLEALASFVVGVPTETAEERQQTIRFAEALGAAVYGFNVFVGIPKSALYDYVLVNKLYEYIDERGLVYMKGHDQRVDEFYNGNETMKIPKRRRFRRIRGERYRRKLLRSTRDR